MPKFDLSTYENVKARKKRFYADHKDGSIIVERIYGSNVLEFAEFKVYIYRNKEEQEKHLPLSTGYALELRDVEKAISRSGAEYESVNYTSWVENCEESAIGRALDNGGYASNGKPSLEEMEKVVRHEQILKKTTVTKPVVKKPAQEDHFEGVDFLDDVDQTADEVKDRCSKCGEPTNEKVTSYSMSKFGKVLCFKHQPRAGGDQ